jgi:glycerol-3-phosphate cytidylyltransferase
VGREQLKRNIMKVGFTTGTFDLVHKGHIELLKEMRKRCDFLIVGLTTDDLGIKQKRIPYLSYSHRKEILENFSFVNSVVKNNGESKSLMLKKLKFDILFIGDDYYDSNEYSQFEINHPEVKCIYIPDVQSQKKISTSYFSNRIENNFLKCFNILLQSTSGYIYKFATQRRNIIVKEIRFGCKEFNHNEPLKNTKDNYNLFTKSPPRNWKIKGCLHEYPNIPGINPSREVFLLNMLDYEWNPFFEGRFVYKNETPPANSKHSPNDYIANYIEESLLERSSPYGIYWAYFEYSGTTLLNYFQNEKFNYDLSKLEILANGIGSIVKQMNDIGVLHDDLHLENILIDEHERIYFIDFGWSLHTTFQMSEYERSYYTNKIETGGDIQQLLDSFDYYNIPQEIKYIFQKHLITKHG